MRYKLKKGIKIGEVYDVINNQITRDIKDKLDKKRACYSKKDGHWVDDLQKTFIIEIMVEEVKQG